MSAVDAAASARSRYARELLGRLVSHRSLEGSPAIEACIGLIAGEVESLARELTRIDHDGVPNLIARFGPTSVRPRLALSGHVDVVPADGSWTADPFKIVEADGCVRGRGVTDMKGGVAAFVAALHALADAGVLEDCPIELVLTGDEEVGSRRGLIPLLADRAVEAPAAVCGEPTGLDVFLGNRGLIWAQVDLRGAGGHAGLAHLLANPIDPLMALVRELNQIPLRARDNRFDPPTPSLTITKLEAGTANDAVNIVPDQASLALDRRLVPGEDVAAARAEIEAAVTRSAGEQFDSQIEFIREWPPYAIDAEEPIVNMARAAVRLTGRSANVGMDLASNDSSWLDQAGVTTVLLGPGAPSEAHTSDEALELAELDDAVRIYANLCHSACTAGAGA